MTVGEDLLLTSFGVHMPLIITPMFHSQDLVQYFIRACSEKESFAFVLLFSSLTHSAIRHLEQLIELYGVSDTEHSFYKAAGTLLTPVEAIY
jgi:hypothetical protein